MVLKPLFFEFPNDSKLDNLATEFMIGTELLVAPVEFFYYIIEKK